MPSRKLRFLSVAAMGAAAILAAHRAAAAKAGDWPTYNHDLAGTRHSSLRQITPRNVAGLRQVWSYKLGPHPTAGSISGGSELTPLVVGGLMYVTTPSAVVALNPDHGTPVWTHALKSQVPSRRGLGYWPGDASRGPRLFVMSGSELLGFDARTGAAASGFGDRGIVHVPVRYDGAPTVFENKVIVGSNSPPGGVHVYDAVSGKLLWHFESIAHKGPQNASWKNKAWMHNSGGLQWAFSMTIDVQRRTLFAVFDAPGPFDYYGGDRPGDDLYANSVVALDVDSGRPKWHFQVVHHDVWDYDIPSPPGLIDVTIDGKRVPVAAIATKTGYMYLLNRDTGKPVFGVKEVPVPASDVPGEVLSPTQPIPVKPPPIARHDFSPSDIVTAADTNAKHAAICRDLARRSGTLVNEGPFTPYVFHDGKGPLRSTILFPGSIGGANWGGTASDPSLGYVFVNTMDEASIGWIERTPKGSHLPFRRNSIVGPTSRFQAFEGNPASGNIAHAGEDAWPCQKPPWGNLVAVDVKTGTIAWKVPLGITDSLPKGKQHTGRLNMGGPITTASGLVFIGATDDRRFRAFDSNTGKELWVTKLAMSAHAVPITYLGRDGRQFVAIAASGAAAIDNPSPPDDAVVAFALP